MEYDQAHKTALFSSSFHLFIGFYDESRVEGFSQTLRFSDPDAGLALAGCLIVAQFTVHAFNQLNAITQRCVDRMDGFSIEIVEFVQAIDPVAFATDVAVMASLIRCFEQAVMRAASLFDLFLYQ